jgi:hypothetical protein
MTRRRRGGRRIRWVRRALAVALFLLAGAMALAPRSRPTGADLVWTAAHSLPAGATLSAVDLSATPATGPPDGAFPTTTPIAGRVLAAPVRRGEILTDVRLVGRAGPDPGPGRVAVPVRPSDGGTVSLLTPGVHVAVVGVTQDNEVRTLARDAVVLSVHGPPGGSVLADSSAPALVVLAVPAAEADDIVALALTGTIGLRFG